MKSRWQAMALLVIATAASSQVIEVTREAMQGVELTVQQRRALEESGCLGPKQVTMSVVAGSDGAISPVAYVTCSTNAYVNSYPVSLELFCQQDLVSQQGWSCKGRWEHIDARFGQRDVVIMYSYRRFAPEDAYQLVADSIDAGDLLSGEQLKEGPAVYCDVGDLVGGKLEVFCGGGRVVKLKRDVSSGTTRYVKDEGPVLRIFTFPIWPLTISGRN